MDIRVEDLQALDPHRFQRLVADLLRAELAGRATVRSWERRPGQKDGGWDVEIVGEAFGLSGEVRVEAKHVQAGTAEELRGYRKLYPSGPLVFVSSETRLTRAKVMDLQRRFPETHVILGGEVAAWARAHPRVSAAHFGGEPEPGPPGAVVGGAEPRHPAGAGAGPAPRPHGVGRRVAPAGGRQRRRALRGGDAHQDGGHRSAAPCTR